MVETDLLWLGDDHAPPPAAGEAGLACVVISSESTVDRSYGSNGAIEHAAGKVLVGRYLPLDAGEGTADDLAANVRA